MDQPSPPFSRILAAAIAAAGLATVALQTTINLEVEGSPLVAFAKLLRFFTIWTNLGGALMFAWLASGRGFSARTLLSLATAYAVVALVYHALLSATHHPIGLDWWTNLMFHTVLPAAAIGWWLAYAPAAAWRGLPAVTIAPVIYTPFALIVGAATDFYPYFFLDQPKLGWAALGGWLVALAGFFLVMGAILRGIQGLLPRRR
ncbi:hypothetical protein A6F68_01151 [Tsuneonella dongtanensis]|uniref:FAR-17a/AIG1-like protein n=1 Tax=Tsuneonella dongtanensis TaxID=692370 RepID=A0A1B2ABY3_9SPHN|nr:Pr6Pr family membrane protein [Tsuneonella dongtanensis]ANY19669.1 hypothetical protein A6F68_01151 [Tsuneonella dongtanensis]